MLKSQHSSLPAVLDHVLMLEPGMVHLESGKEYEDEKNIQEVPIRESILGRFGTPPVINSRSLQTYTLSWKQNAPPIGYRTSFS